VGFTDSMKSRKELTASDYPHNSALALHELRTIRTPHLGELLRDMGFQHSFGPLIESFDCSVIHQRLETESEASSDTRDSACVLQSRAHQML
jgi:hypothetical protein